jgi:hypothetical protein
MHGVDRKQNGTSLAGYSIIQNANLLNFSDEDTGPNPVYHLHQRPIP